MTNAATGKKSILAELSALFQKKPVEQPRDRLIFRGSQESEDVKKGSFNITHAPEMIDGFKDDHNKLVELFQSVTISMIKNDFQTAVIQLEEFLKLLRDHVTEENLRLYGYLRKVDESEDVGIDFKQCQSDMRKIQITVKDFVLSYIKTGIHKGNRNAFLRAWIGLSGETASAKASRQQSIQNTLIERIEFEERRLYPSYLALK